MIFLKKLVFGSICSVNLAFFCAISTPALAGWTLKEDESLFAVFTRKTGIAAGLAHNHLVVATQVKVENFTFGESLMQSAVKLTVPVESLEVDAPETQKKWKPLLEKLKIVNSEVELGNLSENDRKEIKEKIRGDGQLDQKKFPEMTFTLKGVEPSADGKTALLKATAKIHGVEKELIFNMTFEQKDKKAFILSGTAKSKFSDFGVKPFSMIVVGNEDEFDFIVKAVVRAE